MRAGDWLCKEAKGVSRRSNSANPTRPDARLDEETVQAIEAAYRALGQRAYVRLPSFLAPAADRLLARLGYAAEGGTLTLIAPAAGAADPEVEIAATASPEWLAALNRINGRDAQTAAVFDAVVRRLAVPAAFAAVRREGEIVSAAFAPLAGGWLCLEAVATDPAWQGRGLARKVVGALMAWGRAGGCEGAALQVTDGNAPALSLYRRLGFAREVYRYHYRKAAGP